MDIKALAKSLEQIGQYERGEIELKTTLVGPIVTEDEYLSELTLALLMAEKDPPADSPEGQALIAITERIEAYEKIHYPIEPENTDE